MLTGFNPEGTGFEQGTPNTLCAKVLGSQSAGVYVLLHRIRESGQPFYLHVTPMTSRPGFRLGLFFGKKRPRIAPGPNLDETQIPPCPI